MRADGMKYQKFYPWAYKWVILTNEKAILTLMYQNYSFTEKRRFLPAPGVKKTGPTLLCPR
jgi:hypothetical protein